MTKKTNRFRAWLISGAVVAGAGLGSAGIASAATSGSSSSAPAGTSVPTAQPPVNPATMTHGPGETLLTGTDLMSATAAATAAVSGATVIRAESDSAGAAYEVHMQKADGSDVTVKLDSSFAVTAVDQGFGGGPIGGPNTPASPGAVSPDPIQ
jgi:hypothetical protein